MTTNAEQGRGLQNSALDMSVVPSLLPLHARAVFILIRF